MRALRSPALIAAVISAAAAPLLAAAYVRAHRGFGDGDIPVFTLWSLGLGAFLITALPLAYGRLARLSRARRAGLGALCGAVGGIVFTLTLALGMGPWINAFSFPILYLWAGAAALGCAVGAQFIAGAHVARQHRRPLRWSIALAILVLALTAAAPFSLMLGSVYLWNRAEPEVHLLPAGFTGPVVILFDQANGTPPRREGRARVYEIPASGILRTQFRENDGWSSPRYYYVDSAGQRSPVVAGAPCDSSLAGDPVEACLQGTLLLGNQPAQPYSAYIVGRRRDRTNAAEHVDSLIRALVYGVRVPSAP